MGGDGEGDLEGGSESNKYMKVRPSRHSWEKLPGPLPTPVLSPKTGRVAVAGVGVIGVWGSGGGPMIWDTRRDREGDVDDGGTAVIGRPDGGGRGRGEGGTEFKSGAMTMVVHDEM